MIGFVIFTSNKVCCCGKAMTEQIQIADVKRMMMITENTNVSELNPQLYVFGIISGIGMVTLSKEDKVGP